MLLLAHPSLSGMASGSGTSGSTGWNNSVRSRLYLERVKEADGTEIDPDLRRLRVVKANHARAGAEMRLRWQDGVFVSLDDPLAATAFGAIAARDRASRVFLDLLATFEGQGRYVSPHPTSNNYGPTVFSRHPDAEGVTRRAFEDALNGLFADGRSPRREVERSAIAADRRHQNLHHMGERMTLRRTLLRIPLDLRRTLRAGFAHPAAHYASHPSRYASHPASHPPYYVGACALAWARGAALSEGETTPVEPEGEWGSKSFRGCGSTIRMGQKLSHWQIENADR